jgi:hypothetical protein
VFKDKIMKNDSVTTRIIVVGRVLTLGGLGGAALYLVLGKISLFLGFFVVVFGGVIWGAGAIMQGFLETKSEGVHRIVWTGRIALLVGLVFMALLYAGRGVIGLTDAGIFLSPGIFVWVVGWILEGQQLQ